MSRLPIDKAIGFDPSSDKPFYAKCRIMANLGGSFSWLHAGYRWNGADEPRAFWSVWGVTPTDPRVVLASGFHDQGTEDENTPQVLADAMFISLLGNVHFNDVLLPGINWFQQFVFYTGVRFYSLFCRPTTRLFFRKES